MSLKQGEQESRYLGTGTEYEESRPYQPGDEVRRIHWRLMARTGQPFTKQYLEERQESWSLLVDQRSTMRFGSKKQLKVQQAIRVAGWYAWEAEQNGLPVEGIRLSDKAYLTPWVEGRGSFERIMTHFSVACPPLTQEASNKEARLSDELLECRQRLRDGDRLIIISDFHDLDDTALKWLAALQSSVMVKAILITDPLEKQLPAMSGVQLQGLSSGTTFEQLTPRLRETYGLWSKAYFEGLRAQLKTLGIAFIELSVEDELGTLLEPERWQ